MDSDLIRKADVQKILKALYDNRQYSDVTSTLFVAMENIHDLPTVDAVEVVRCKDCKYRDPENGHCDHYMGTAIPLTRRLVDFCSYGEKMDGGEKE